ncbi:sensor histidine kinase [Actinomadura formosensis]|uniref:sensor histidine kinase n=1 Tax=Actinomadura formosensis TaxID=60706 RepID=UPI00082D1318|nr:HAMP domain-containing sensor histidine kinase [Actinomadura formosensis]
MSALGSLLVAAVVVAAAVLHLLAGVQHTGVLLLVTAVLCVVAVALASWGVRHAVARALEPVDRLQAEMAELGDTDLSRRVGVPPAGDGAEQLAGRVNELLGRLENAAEQRRAFIAGASHELRTPLTGLRTRIELALLDDPADSDLVDNLRRALGDAERLHQIVDDLLVLARLDSGDPPAGERLDLGALVEREVARQLPPIPVSVKAETGVMVTGSGVRLGRVLVNLLANAQRYAAARIEVAVRAEDGEAVVEVYDDGPGIPPADRERVFERFARLDSARSRDKGGSGLGLPIARQIAVAHGGRLYIADGPYGARLVLRLPLAR